MSTSKVFSEKFKGMDKIPMPIFITDVYGKILYKNEFSKINYNFRIGSNILKYADDCDEGLLKNICEARAPSTVMLKCDDWVACCLVAPKKFDDGETCFIFSSVPYFYDISDEMSKDLSDNNDTDRFLNEFEENIQSVLSCHENDENVIPSGNFLDLKNSALKLMRLEKRLRTKLLPKGEEISRSFSDKTFLLKDLELCSFTSHMCKIFNSLSAIGGISLTYIPENRYSICKAVHSDVAMLFVFLAMFCVKFSPAGKANVFVKESDDKVCIVFESQMDISNIKNIIDFDFAYISAIARNVGYKAVLEEGQDGMSCVKLYFGDRMQRNTEYLSASDILFNVSENYIKEVFGDASELIGLLCN